jgi:hypothetical protein
MLKKLLIEIYKEFVMGIRKNVAALAVFGFTDGRGDRTYKNLSLYLSYNLLNSNNIY